MANKCLMNCSHHNKMDWGEFAESRVGGEDQKMQAVYLLYTHAVVHRIWSLPKAVLVGIFGIVGLRSKMSLVFPR